MALTQEEIAIIEYGKANGKTREQSLAALGKFRQEKAEQVGQESGYTMGDTMGDIKEVGSDLMQTGRETVDGIKASKDDSLSGKQGILRGLAQSFGQGAIGLSKGIGNLFTGAVKTVLPQTTEDATKQAIGATVQTVAPTAQAVDTVAGDLVGRLIGDEDPTPLIGTFLQNYQSLDPQAKRDVDALFGVSSLAVEALGVGGTKRIASGIGEVAGEGVQGINNSIKRTRSVVDSLIEKAPDIIKPKPAPIKAVGEVLQGTKPVSAKDLQAFRNIELDGVSTFSDLSNKINDSISSLSRRVDDALLEDTNLYKLDELTIKTPSNSGKIIESNYAETALDNLKELYAKTADDVRLADIEDVIAKAKTDGLTRKEVNDISRLYNQEFGSKAFGKLGDPLTSVNAQAYENIRKGLKNVARQGLGGAEAKEADRIVSSLYDVKTLVNKNTVAVQRLQQKIAERGLLEKVGHAVAKYGDVLTGGSIRGLVGGLLPRGAGYKVLNALDIEDRLKQNLEIIKKALEGNSDEAIINAAKKLEEGGDLKGSPSMGKIVDDPLVQEARKYKSAEEFVRSADTEKLYFNKVVEDINARLPNKEVRITPNSVGVLKGNIRGSWIDNDDVWTFYPSKSIPEEFRVAVQQKIPEAKVMNGAIDFPKDKFPSLTKSQLTDVWKKANEKK